MTKKYERIPLTCADCKHHNCSANTLIGCGDACTGTCVKTCRHMHCNRRARGCNFFEQVDWHGIIGGELCS